jgi:hypothetical protein
MRKKRCLTQDVWYEVRTTINNYEPLFRRRQAITIFCRVFGEAEKHFAFELRGFALVEERLSFYIRPADGLQLPAIMQWLKQTFAVRFNRRTGRTGYVWGDRYWSQAPEGEPPEGTVEVDWAAVDVGAETGEISFGMCPPVAENPAESEFSPQNPARSRLRPAKRPNPARNRVESTTQPSWRHRKTKGHTKHERPPFPPE